MTETTPTIEEDVSTLGSGSASRTNTSNGSNSTNNNTNNRRNNNNQYRGSRRDQNLALLSVSDKDFKGADEEFGHVIGLPTESKLLKNGLVYSEYEASLLTYVQKNYIRGNDLRPLIKELKNPAPEVESKKEAYPSEANPPVWKVKEWELKLKRHMDRMDQLEENTQKLYGLLTGQCTPGLLAEIKGEADYEKEARDTNALWLLTTIKQISAGVDSKANVPYVYHEQLCNLVSMKQGPLDTMEGYRTNFESSIKTMEMTGGECLFYPRLKMSADDDEKKEMKESVKAMWFLMHSDKIRFGAIISRMKEQYNLGNKDIFPTTVVAVYDLLIRTEREADEDRLRREGRNNNRGVQFTQYGGRGNGNGGRGNGNNYTGGRGGRGNGHGRIIPDGATIVRGLDNRVHNIQCRVCNEYGHYASQCPTVPPEGKMMNEQQSMSTMTSTYLFSQIDNFTLTSSIRLLDTCASHSSTNSSSTCRSMRKCTAEETLIAETNGGSAKFEHMGMLKLLPIPCYYNPDTLATILAFHEVVALDDVEVKYDSEQENAFFVLSKSSERVMKFKQCGVGLYYYDESRPEEHEFKKSNLTNTQLNYNFLTSINRTKSLMSRREIKRADQARKYQEILGWPSTAQFKAIVANNLVTNCDISVDDITRASDIYGEPIATLKGKMTRKSPQSHDDLVAKPLPKELHEKRIDLYVDVFFTAGQAFLLTKSGRINFYTVDALKTQKMTDLLQALKRVMNMYDKRELMVITVHGDNQFDGEELADALRPANMEIYAANEHVGIIERGIRTVKERTRSTVHGLPYIYYTRLMVKHLVARMVEMLNTFPSKNGVSDTISPNELVLGKNKFDLGRKHIRYGSFAEVYFTTKNTNEARSTHAIALRPAAGEGYYFMNLATGKELHSNRWTELPMGDDVISRVHTLAKREKQRKVHKGNLRFEWAPGVPIIDADNDDADDNEEEADDDNENVDEDENIEGENANGGNDDDNDDDGNDGNAPAVIQDDEGEQPDEGERQHHRQQLDNMILVSEAESGDEDIGFEAAFTGIHLEEDSDDETVVYSKEEMDANRQRIETREGNDDDDSFAPREAPAENQGADQQPMGLVMNEDGVRHSARIRRRDENTSGMSGAAQHLLKAEKMEDKYAQAFSFLMKEREEEKPQADQLRTAVGVVFAQMSAKKGIREFGMRAVSALIKEFTQQSEGAFPGKPVVIPIDPDGLSKQDIEQALEAVTLIEKKRDGRVKGRVCANGSKQRKYLKEGESVASPTVSVEALITALLIAAHEGREVVSFDIPGAFLQAEMSDDKLVLLVLRGEFVDYMCEVNPEHIPNVRYDKRGKKVLYMRVVRAIYGCIESALQWYKLFKGTLEDMGFELNPYDQCVANKMIDGKQCTFVWYVDDCIATHMSSAVLKQISDSMQKNFGEMSIETGSTHDFLGMKIKIRKDKKIEIDMRDQVKTLISDFEKEGKEIAPGGGDISRSVAFIPSRSKRSTIG